MNNRQKTMTYLECCEIVDKLNLPAIEELALTQILIAYTWMSSKEIFINASSQDIVQFFLDDRETIYLRHPEEKYIQ